MTTDAEEHACRIATARQMILDLNEAFKVLGREGYEIDAQVETVTSFETKNKNRSYASYPRLHIRFLKDCE